MDKSAKQTIGDRLRMFRESRKQTQSQFANEMDMSTTGLQSNEANRSLPNSKLLIELYQRGLNINWLISGDGAMLQTEVATLQPKSNDLSLFAEAMEVIDLYLEKSGKTMSPANKRKAVEALYKLSIEKNRIDPAVIEIITQLAA